MWEGNYVITNENNIRFEVMSSRRDQPSNVFTASSNEVKSNLKENQGIEFLLERKYYGRASYRYRRTLSRGIEAECVIYGGGDYVRSKNDMCAYRFKSTNGICHPQINHHQLRSGIKALNDHTVLYSQKLGVYKFDNSFKNNLPMEKGVHGSHQCIVKFEGERSQISAMDVLQHPSIGTILGIGTLRGELHLTNLRNGDVLFHKILDEDDPRNDNYMNGVQVTKPTNYSQAFCLTSSNDNKCRVYCLEGNRNEVSPKLVHVINHTESINFGKMNPINHNLVCLVGDFKEVLMYDLRLGKFVSRLSGHLDDSFSMSWNPNLPQFQFANACQDHSVGIFDLRKNEMVYRLMSTMDHVRSVEYSEDGKFLGMIEAVDFMHVYDVKDEYRTEQLIDVFGSLGGFSFSPKEGNSLFLGVADPVYRSIMEFSKIKFGRESSGVSNILM